MRGSLVVGIASLLFCACATSPNARGAGGSRAHAVMGPAAVALLARAQASQLQTQVVLDALDSGAAPKANAALAMAASELRAMEERVPGATLLVKIDEVGARLGAGEEAADELTAMIEEARPLAVFLPPAVPAHLELAQGQRAEAAFKNLASARALLEADITWRPLEEARKATGEARRALTAGDRDTTRRHVLAARSALDAVQDHTPLVPVRFALRAAALAADDGKLELARGDLGYAVDSLEALHRAATGALAARLAPLVDEARALLEGIDDHKKPQAESIRRFVERVQRPDPS